MKAFFWRALRVSGSIVLAGLAVKYKNNEAYMVAAPIISGTARWLREKYPSLFWVPL